MRIRGLTEPPRTAGGGAGLVLLGAFMIQWSAAIVMPIISRFGGSAASGWRFLLGAGVLLIVVRPKVRSWDRDRCIGVVVFGLSSAVMNQCFFQAIHRIHLGTAVAIEYLGPFLVAALGKRSWRHFCFVLLAMGGVLALARPGGHLSVAGILFAAGAGVGWAAYAFASHRVGGDGDGYSGLAVSMSIGALLTLPTIFSSAHTMISTPHLWIRMLLVAIMATVIGFGAEMQALRRLKPSIVSVLMALDPAVAFLVGLVILHQSVQTWDLVGMLCVVVAGVGVTVDESRGAVEIVR